MLLAMSSESIVLESLYVALNGHYLGDSWNSFYFVIERGVMLMFGDTLMVRHYVFDLWPLRTFTLKFATSLQILTVNCPRRGIFHGNFISDKRISGLRGISSVKYGRSLFRDNGGPWDFFGVLLGAIENGEIFISVILKCGAFDSTHRGGLKGKPLREECYSDFYADGIMREMGWARKLFDIKLQRQVVGQILVCVEMEITMIFQSRNMCFAPGIWFLEMNFPFWYAETLQELMVCQQFKVPVLLARAGQRILVPDYGYHCNADVIVCRWLITPGGNLQMLIVRSEFMGEIKECDSCFVCHESLVLLVGSNVMSLMRLSKRFINSGGVYLEVQGDVLTTTRFMNSVDGLLVLSQNSGWMLGSSVRFMSHEFLMSDVAQGRLYGGFLVKQLMYEDGSCSCNEACNSGLQNRGCTIVMLDYFGLGPKGWEISSGIIRGWYSDDMIYLCKFVVLLKQILGNAGGSVMFEMFKRKFDLEGVYFRAGIGSLIDYGGLGGGLNEDSCSCGMLSMYSLSTCSGPLWRCNCIHFGRHVLQGLARGSSNLIRCRDIGLGCWRIVAVKYWRPVRNSGEGDGLQVGGKYFLKRLILKMEVRAGPKIGRGGTLELLGFVLCHYKLVWHR